jgi:hypothetical protein
MMDRELDTAGSEPVRPKACGAAPTHIEPRPGDDIDDPPSPQEDAKMEDALAKGASGLDDTATLPETESKKQVKGKELKEVAAAQDIAVPLCSSLPDLSKAAADAIHFATSRALSIDEARAIFKCRASLPISCVPPADAEGRQGCGASPIFRSFPPSFLAIADRMRMVEVCGSVRMVCMPTNCPLFWFYSLQAGPYFSIIAVLCQNSLGAQNKAGRYAVGGSP